MATIYLSGPMRSLPLYNFPAFHDAAKELRALGLTVISPAEIDEATGFDPTGSLDNFDMDEAIRRDVEGVLSSDALVVLPGWENSTGTQGEMAVAKWAGRGILFYEEILESPSTIQELCLNIQNKVNS